MTEPAPAGHDCIVAAGTPLHRIHRDRPGAIAWFDKSAHGRFNLTDVPDGGTCYLAHDPLGAYIETLGRILTRISESRSPLVRSDPLRGQSCVLVSRSRSHGHDRRR